MSSPSLTLDKFDCEGDPTSVGARWERWKRALNIYLEAAGIGANEKKKASLLHFGGIELQEIFYNIPGANVEPAQDVNVFTVALSKLDSYFAPKQNKLFERHVFRLIKQEPNEKFDKFMIRLRRQADKCQFKDKDECIIDQVTEKCLSIELRKKILQIGDDITVDRIILEANTLEALNKQMEEFSAPAKTSFNVNKVESKSKKRFDKHTKNTPSCTRCGNTRHASNDPKCPARDKTCLKCDLKGHFRQYCRTILPLRRKHSETNSTDSKRQKITENTVNQIRDETTKRTQYIFHIDDDTEFDCSIGGVNTKVLIDSGCKQNLITAETWETMKSKGIEVQNQIAKPDVTFMAYGKGTPLEVKGAFEAELKIGSKSQLCTFYVIRDGTRNLLGKLSAMSMGILKIGLDLEINNVGSEKFPKFKDVKIELPIDRAIPAVAQPHRRIPMPLEEKVEEKINELIRKDIIEEVPGSSRWVSPIVPILKDNGEINSPVLVVELKLNRLEGTQLRALGLLSVFGFNVTYAVRGPAEPPGPPSCSAIECRLLGHCYASNDYREFFCACFEGYSGADCGVGPLCPRTNMCKNGGTCSQMGPAAVSCACAPGFTGDFCESQNSTPVCGIEECSESCKEGRNCDCDPKDSDFNSARFETKLQIVDQADSDISQDIVKQISSYLKASNITLEGEVEILNISSVETNGERTVWLRVWGARREAGAVRASLAALTGSRARADKLRLLNFDMQPALTLHALIMNQRPEVWEGSEFILSCMAYGSPDIAFVWYKDGVKVNFNATTRDIWTRTVAEDALGRRMSVLGITEARTPDSGRWSCSADDAGRRRCRALELNVLKPPDIRLLPTALTVNKGDNVSITCLAVAGRMHGVLGFSWARDKNLLPMVPGREVWEDLYPAGSVLKLFDVQKSGQYNCQVSSVAGTNSKGVTMWVLGPNDEACETEPSHGLRWPRTAPGAHASAVCPPGHSGETTRFCEPKTGQHGVKWRLPDFSGCVADSLKNIYEQFSRISYGYSWGNVSDVAHQYWAVLRSLPSHPGEGTLPLQHSRQMLYYLLSAAGKPRDRTESVPHLLKIYDTLLKHPDTFLDEEKIYELQNAVADAAGMRDSLDLHLHQFIVKTKPVREDNAAHFKIKPEPTGTEEWLLTSVGVELVGRNGNASVIAIKYHSLGARLPSLRGSIEYKSGREMEFLVASPQAQLWGAGVDRTLPHTVTLLFRHVFNYSAVASKLACGVRTAEEPRVWSTNECEVRITDPTYVSCRCRGLGTYALFTVARSTLTDVEKDLRGIVKITVGLGGAMCLAAAALQVLGLASGRKARLPVLLKAVTAGTHSAALLALLECDTRQLEACPGALGWVCAACWCAGCAALCAQPLLLQAELAGRQQRAPSVGLLAGVCTLAWLTARLWGGAPLQLGAAAQAVCAAGCALLALLCFALAVCAALRLRTITHKVPAERRNYLADRTRVVRHTLALLLTTSAAQAAGVAYAQPGERRVSHVAALSAAALANGVAMLICYVIRDEECLQSARRALSMGEPREWQDSPAGDTSLSLYIKGGGEVESRGGVTLESSPPPASPGAYWRAPAAALDTPTRLHRRQSTPDSRADIVRCVEYKESTLSPHRYSRHSRTVCDLIPHAAPAQHEYVARVCLELGVLEPAPAPPRDPLPPLLTCSVDFEPYTERRFDTAKENCTLCVQSNPDVSKIPSPPIKSCLKKSNKNQEFTSSISLPSMEILKDEPKSKSDIDQVNREWNKAYDSPETDQMLNKISNDLDFLLNRTQDASVNVILDQIEEAPT